MILQDNWMKVPISHFSSYENALMDAEMYGIKAALYSALNDKANPFKSYFNDVLDIDLNVFNNLAIHVYKLIQYDNSFPLLKTCEALVCFPQFANQINYFDFLIKDYFEFDQKYNGIKFQMKDLPFTSLFEMIEPYLADEKEFERNLFVGKVTQIDR